LHTLVYKLLKFFYRLIAPRHPRGYIDFFTILDEPTNPHSLITATTIGLAKFGLTDFAIEGIPPACLGNSHAILLEIITYVHTKKPIQSGEHFHGFLVAPQQPSLHHATFHSIPVLNPAQKSLLKVVDLGEPQTAVFPQRLFAAHLNALAANMNKPMKARILFERSLSIHPGNEAPLPREFSDFDDNENNCLAYFGMSNCLYDLGDLDGALQFARMASEKSRTWALQLQKQMKKQIPVEHWSSISDPVTLYWLNLIL
jgi:tetratricopeptide (TPR) repeat protein